MKPRDMIGLATGNHHEFLSLWRKKCIEAQQREDEWIVRLCKLGIRAAHPDDGWVKDNKLHLCYPQFNLGVEVGDLVALGNPNEYRIVRLVGKTETLLDLIWWKFEEEKDVFRLLHGDPDSPCDFDGLGKILDEKD